MKLSESFFDTGEISLHVMEGPRSGSPLVLLHGATSNWQDWQGLLPQLVDHWHVYVLDQRGHGESGRAADIAGYHLSAFAGDALAFLRGRVRQPAVLYGHSWGAVTAMLCGGPARHLVSGLVLEDPPVHLRHETPAMNPIMNYFAWTRDMLRANASLEAFTRVLRQQNPDMPAEELAKWASAIFHTDPVYLDAVLTRSGVAQGLNFEQAIQEIACPILLLQADLAKGSAMDDGDVDLFRRNAHHLEIVYFEGAGHGIHDERPAQVVELVNAFPQKISASLF